MKRYSIALLLVVSSVVSAQVAYSQKKSNAETARLDIKTLSPVLSFKIEDRKSVKGKSVELYAKHGLLHYAFVDSTGKIEFSYPKETDKETPGFFLDTAKNDLSVSFANKTVGYRVYEQRNKIGVEATIGGVLYEQIGVVGTKKGNLKDLLKMKLDNVIIR